MKTKKSILSAAVIVALFSICFTVNAQPVLKMASTVAVSDTGKMDKMSKMDKTDKMSKDKMKSDKMSKDKMSKDKMSKSDKMSKDKMSKMKDTSKMSKM